MSAPGRSTRPAAVARLRRSISLVEILVTLAVLSTLAIPFLEMMTTSKRKVTGVPRRLCALYFAQDLLEERLDQERWSDITSIGRLRLTEFNWIDSNLERIEQSETGERQKRIQSAREFLYRFKSKVTVSEPVAGKRKRVAVIVEWDEAGRAENVRLNSEIEW